MTGTARPRPPFAPAGPDIPRPIVSSVPLRRGRLRRDVTLVALAVAIVMLALEGGVLLAAVAGPAGTTQSPSASATPIPSATPIATAVPTAIATESPIPTASPSPIPSATVSATQTPTPAPTAVPVVTPVPTPLPVVTPAPTGDAGADDPADSGHLVQRHEHHDKRHGQLRLDREHRGLAARPSPGSSADRMAATSSRRRTGRQHGRHRVVPLTTPCISRPPSGGYTHNSNVITIHVSAP